MGRGVEHGPLGAVAVSIGGLIASLTREVADFPEPGIQFKDLTPLLADAHGLDGNVSSACRTPAKAGGLRPVPAPSLPARPPLHEESASGGSISTREFE